jgi:hypothetical protein
MLILAVVGAAFFAYATTRVRQPTGPELSTVWVGWADSSHYFRLQLLEDGTGLFSLYERSRSASRLYEITKWTLKGYDIEIISRPIDPDAWPVTMKGTANPMFLHLKLGDGRKSGWRAQAMFERESFIESAMDSAKKRMQDYRKPEEKK